MSMESARAFVVRLMSDADFRGKLATVKAEAEIDSLVAEYSFTKDELARIVGEFMGHKLAEGELEKLIGEAFEGQETSPEAVPTITAWLNKK